MPRVTVYKKHGKEYVPWMSEEDARNLELAAFRDSGQVRAGGRIFQCASIMGVEVLPDKS